MPKGSLAKSLPRRVKKHAFCVGEGRLGVLFSGVWWKNGEELAMETEGRGGYDVDFRDLKRFRGISFY